jgi:hypothetical protein
MKFQDKSGLVSGLGLKAYALAINNNGFDDAIVDAPALALGDGGIHGGNLAIEDAPPSSEDEEDVQQPLKRPRLVEEPLLCNPLEQPDADPLLDGDPVLGVMVAADSEMGDSEEPVVPRRPRGFWPLDGDMPTLVEGVELAIENHAGPTQVCERLILQCPLSIWPGCLHPQCCRSVAFGRIKPLHMAAWGKLLGWARGRQRPSII